GRARGALAKPGSRAGRRSGFAGSWKKSGRGHTKGVQRKAAEASSRGQGGRSRCRGRSRQETGRIEGRAGQEGHREKSGRRERLKQERAGRQSHEVSC